MNVVWQALEVLSRQALEELHNVRFPKQLQDVHLPHALKRIVLKLKESVVELVV